eukprot:TRINITY_DN3755_c0_g1_i1.p1 TRINITY_DN3755_c0_g1~~TRINITY_DN3755_c0_g1_i1.p1  ORF type:complete len:310 (+),score=14.77 TRINITY_DN3755_c0_g1_i1:223-1152(+)
MDSSTPSVTQQLMADLSTNQAGAHDATATPSLLLPASRLVSAFLNFDRNISARLHSLSNRSLAIILEHTGDGLYWIPGTIAMWLCPIAMPPALRCCILNLFVAFILDLIVVGTLKSLVRRRRPVYNRGMTVVLAPDKWSFPSGHASRALLIASFAFLCKETLGPFLGQNVEQMHSPLPNDLQSGKANTFATVASLELPLSAALSPDASPSTSDERKMYIVFICLSIWAASTALSRVFLGRHYLMDVLVGGVVGFLEAYAEIRMFWVPVPVAEALSQFAQDCLHLRSTCTISSIMDSVSASTAAIPVLQP